MIKQTDPHKRGKSARRKGKGAEIAIARIFREQYGIDVRRGHVFDHESDLVGIPGIHPEVKRQERLNVFEAMDQAVEEAAKRKDGVPTVFFRKDRTDWLVAMRLNDWVEMYKSWEIKNHL